MGRIVDKLSLYLLASTLRLLYDHFKAVQAVRTVFVLSNQSDFPVFPRASRQVYSHFRIVEAKASRYDQCVAVSEE